MEDEWSIEAQLKRSHDRMIQILFAEREALGRAENKITGQARGKAKGRVRAFRIVIITIVERRFPPLIELAQQKLVHVKKLDVLDLLLEGLIKASDENMARLLLELAAAVS